MNRSKINTRVQLKELRIKFQARHGVDNKYPGAYFHPRNITVTSYSCLEVKEKGDLLWYGFIRLVLLVSLHGWITQC